MWRARLNQLEYTTTFDDTVLEEERSISTISATTAGVSSNDALLPSSAASGHYNIEQPYIATPVIPQICSGPNIVEMSTNFQPSRNRNQNSIHFRNLLPHSRSYRTRYCNHRNTIEEANFNLRVVSNELSNNRMSPIPEDDHLLALAENEMSPAELAFEIRNSVRGLSAPLSFEPEPSNIEDENNGPSLFESANEFYMNHFTEPLLDSGFKSNDARGQILETPRPLLDPFQVGNESLSPLLRTIRGLPSPTLSAQKLANKLIKLSGHLRWLPDLADFHCLNCNRIPRLPVTGKCGHSRCLHCIKQHGACPCGAMSPKKLTVNTVMREITEKMTKYIKKPRIPDPTGPSIARLSISTRGIQSSAPRGVQYKISRNSATATSAPKFSTRPREPMNIQDRQRKARELVIAGQFVEAVPHLASVAASTQPFAHMARKLLSQTITVLCQSSEPQSLSRKLIHSVRNQSPHSWIRPSDLECVICTSILKDPVTTPCGHSYCRGCLERSMYYMMKCALCLSPLRDFRVDDASDNLFMKSLLSSIEEVNISEDVNVIPIVTCYVAFPGMPCPLFIFDPKCWQMVRRVTESGSRKFGMLAYEEGNTNGDYGTVLEICDCVVLEDNRCIISTMGVSRFKIIERFVKDGCDLARVGILRDVLPKVEDVTDICFLDAELRYRTLKWLKRMDESMQEEIETAFGPLPYIDMQESWWETADGPHWLWWVIAILPLKPEIKILMISTSSLFKRMLAVSRTFDVMNVELESSTENFQTTREADEPNNSRWSLEDM